MVDRIITAEAIIRAKDETGPAFKAITDKVEQLGKKLGMVGKATALKTDLDTIEKKLSAIDKFKGAQDGLNRATLKLRETKIAADQAEKALAAAAKPTRALAGANEAAQRAVQRANEAYEKQRAILQASRSSLREAGVAAGSLAAEERRLKGAIDQANTSLSRQVALTHQAAAGQGRLARAGHFAGEVGRHLLVGGTMLGGGYLAARGIERVAERGADLQAALNKIRNVSNSEGEVALARDLAGRASGAFPYTTRTQSLEDYVELRSLAVSNKHGEAINREAIARNVMLMARTRAALASSGYTLEPGEAKSLAQAIEGSGRTLDPRAQEKMLDAYVRAKQVFGNAIQAHSVRDFVANAKASNFSASDESFFFTTMARLAQGNASRLGNEFNQTIQTIVGGHMTKAGAEWLSRVGVIQPNQIRKGGGGKFYIAGKVKEQDLLSTDQTAWAQTVLLAGIQRAGALNSGAIAARSKMLRDAELRANPNAHPDEHTIEERALHGVIADFVSKSGFRTTVTDNLVHAIANAYQTQKDVEQMKSATGLGASENIGRNPVAAFGELGSAISSLVSTASSPAAAAAAPMLHSLAGSVAHLGTAAEANPGAAALAIGIPGAFAIGAGAKIAIDWVTAGSTLTKAGAELIVAAEALKTAAGVPANGKTAAAAGGATLAGRLVSGLSGLTTGAAVAGGALLFTPNSLLSPHEQEVRASAVETFGRWFNRMVTGAAPGEEHLPYLEGTRGGGPRIELGEGRVRVDVHVDGGQVTNTFASSSGNIRVDVGNTNFTQPHAVTDY